MNNWQNKLRKLIVASKSLLVSHFIICAININNNCDSNSPFFLNLCLSFNVTLVSRPISPIVRRFLMSCLSLRQQNSLFFFWHNERQAFTWATKSIRFLVWIENYNTKLRNTTTKRVHDLYWLLLLLIYN